jgi:surface antigen
MRQGRALRGVAIGLLVSALAACASSRTALVSGAGQPAVAASRADLALQQALEHLPDGQSLNWSDDRGHAGGIVTVERTFQNDSGTDCRGFSQRLTNEAGTRTAAGTACRAASGRWVIEPV